MDVAVLGIRVDAGGAITALDRLGGTLAKTSKSADVLSFTGRRQEETLRSLARSVVAAGGEVDRFGAKIIRLNGGLEAFKRIQAQVNAEMASGVTRTLDLAVATDKVSRSKSNAAFSATKLQGGLKSLATSVIGLNSQVAGLANVLGTFAVGSGVMGGILAGLAAVGFAYNKLTEDSRAAKKATDDLVGSLVAARNARLGETTPGKAFTADELQGKLAAAEKALANAQRAQRIAAAPGGSFGGGNDLSGLGAGINTGPKLAEIKKLRDAVDEANDALRKARLRDAGESAQIATDAAAMQKSLADDGRRSSAEAAGRRKKDHSDEVARFNERIALARALADLASDPLAAASDKIGTRLNNFFDPASNQLTQTYQSPEDPELARLFEAEEKKRQARLTRPLDEAAKEVSKFSQGLKTAGQTISQAAEYFLVSKLGGGSAGGSLGGGVGKSAAGALGGFGATALGGALFGPLLAGIGAFLGDKIGGLFGSTSAERQQAREQKRSQADLAATMEILRAKTQGLNVELLEQIEANRKFFSQLKKQIEDALPGKKNEANRNRQLAEVERFRQAEDEKIRRDYDRAQREKREDLEVRALRAQGKNKEAEALRKQLDDAREIADAEKSGADAAYIARLKEIQAIERGTKALDELTGSLRNAPAGFKVQPYQFEFGASKAFEPKYPDGPSIPYSPERPAFPRAGTSSGTVSNTYTFSFPGTEFIIEGNTSEEMFKSFIQKLRQKKDATLGVTGTLSEALDRM